MPAAEKLNPEVATTDLISVESIPASISCNFEEVKARLETELEKYDLVVTADTVTDAKKLATELNKSATEFSKRRRDAVSKVSGPIRLFEDQMKQLEGMCKDGRTRILDQVQRFEDETRATVKDLLEHACLEAWENIGVEKEFRRAHIDDLIKLTSLTKKGNLTAVAHNELRARVAANKQLQDQTSMRLVMLENQSYKAGLAAPLTRDHVNSFLFADDQRYQANLDRIIASELERQEKAETAMRARLEREQNEAERQAQQTELQSPRQKEAPEQAHKSIPEPASRDPEPMQAPTNGHPVTNSERHAFGLLHDPASAKVVRCSRLHAEQMVNTPGSDDAYGVWTPDGLVSIVYHGEVFRKA